MRSSRVIEVLVVVALILVPSAVLADATATPEPVVSEEVLTATPSKVCHPKKPITCRASDLQVDMASLLAPQNQPVQEAGLCFGPRWLCRVNEFDSNEAIEDLTKPRLESEEAGLCFGPRWLCRAESLN